MRLLRVLPILGLLVASPSWSSLVGPCDPGTPLPVWLEIAPPICPGQPLNLVARACGPCVDLLYSTQAPGEPLRIVAAQDYRSCVTRLCLPESLSVPLGSFASGHHEILVHLLLYNLIHDSTTCTVERTDTLRFDVPRECKPPPPLPYTEVIRVGPPPPCATCPPPPICPGLEIPFFIAGQFPNDCYQFRGLELRPSPIMGPLPEPPIARVYVARNACSPCRLFPVPWEASTMLPPLPPRDYNLMVEMAVSDWCDSTHIRDTLYTALVPFQVAESCSVPPPPQACFLHSWRDVSPDPDCETVVGPGTPGRTYLQIWADTPLARLRGRLQLTPPDLRIVGLRPAGIASGMQLTWDPLRDGASFELFSAIRSTIDSRCMPPAMCPPMSEPVLEVLVAERPGVPIPPLTLLDALELEGTGKVGNRVLECPTFAAIPPARICRGRSCDFNGDGHLDMRDLVLMRLCVSGRGECPDSAVTRFDCNGDGALTVEDVRCCAHVILHGRLPAGLLARPEPGLGIDRGASVATLTGLDVPIRLNGANRVGAGRLTLAYPASRFDRAGVEILGDAASWVQVSEALGGELIIGLVATAGAEEVPGRLDLVVHFGLAAGQTASSDVRIVGTEFVAPDGAVLEPASSTTDVPASAPPFRLLAARPNPFSVETRFVLSVAEAADVDLGVFDLAGRRVATLHHGPLGAGDHPFVWDGMCTDGRRAEGGVYFCRVLGAGSSAAARLILLGAR